jgi:hypothetical protein
MASVKGRSCPGRCQILEKNYDTHPTTQVETYCFKSEKMTTLSFLKDQQ